MKSTAKTLALGAALLCLLAGGMALPASAAVPLTGTAVSLPWNSDNSVPAESIEVGTYSSNMLLGETQQLSPTAAPPQQPPTPSSTSPMTAACLL